MCCLFALDVFVWRFVLVCCCVFSKCVLCVMCRFDFLLFVVSFVLCVVGSVSFVVVACCALFVFPFFGWWCCALCVVWPWLLFVDCLLVLVV